MFWFALASCSALLSAAAAVLQKKILFRLNALEFSFLVSIAILIFSSFIPFSMDVTSVTPSLLMIIVGKSILGGAAFLLVMMSLEHNQISTALPILGMTPAVTAGNCHDDGRDVHYRKAPCSKNLSAIQRGSPFKKLFFYVRCALFICGFICL